MPRSTSLRRLVLLVGTAAVGACSDPTAPNPPVSKPSELLFLEPTVSNLIQCPAFLSLSTSLFIGSIGGEVSVGGHRVIVPAGAIPSGQIALVTLIVPASRYVEIDARVNGLPHFQFAAPVTVVISYDRCPRSNIDQVPLRAWHINPWSNAFIEDMGGVDDKTARTVTFSTDHFSGYAIAQ